MPVSTGKSSLFEQLGSKLLEAHNEHAADETKVDSFGDLPAGIVGGVAQVTKVWFDTFKKGDNAGKPYYMAMATVKRPKEAPDGSIIEGLSTKIGPIPLCDTPKSMNKKTVSDHLKDVYDELRKLGVNTKTLDPKNLELVATLLTKQKPHIKFRTWKGEATPAFPQPRTQHIWMGLINFSENGAPHVEESASAESVDETAFQPAEGDLAALVAAAESGDDDAGAKLTSMALEAGVSNEKVENATSWSDVGELITAANRLLPAAPTSSGDIKSGSCWYYKPPKMKKAVECEVTSVEGNTCNLRRLDNGLVYQNVSTSSLQPNP